MTASLLAMAQAFLPPSASTVAPLVDRVFQLIFWICAAFFVLIVAVALLFVVRYRERRWSAPAPSATHNMRLEVLWSVIPLGLAMLMFGTGTAAYLDMVEPKDGRRADAVQVSAKKWSWWFDHAGGKGAGDLHVVAGRPVELTMSSADVIHSLYIPAFRLKQDVVPGRYTKLRFEATEPGVYPIYCAEYCGTNHSIMAATVVVHPDKAAFDAWLRQPAYDDSIPLPEIGQKVYAGKGCATCHSIDGSPRVGPSFKGIWGKTETTADGESVTVDENYVRESIVKPKAKVVVGFAPVMPPTILEERELLGIIRYLQSLQ